MDFVTGSFSPFALGAILCCVVIIFFMTTSTRSSTDLPWVALDEDPTTKGINDISKARKQWVENCNAVIDKGLREVSLATMQIFQPVYDSQTLHAKETSIGQWRISSSDRCWPQNYSTQFVCGRDPKQSAYGFL